MNVRAAQIIGLVLALTALFLGFKCRKDAKSALNSQTNASITFYGRVVDQEGRSLGGAKFEFRAEAYPKNWTFETRGQDNEAWTITAVSDENGLFRFQMTGCKLIRMKADRDGYRHFCDDETDSTAIDNRFYRLIAWSYLWHKPNPDNPALYVFVKDGARVVSALPCRGGSDSGGSTRWNQNKPGWPKRPSLTDVAYKPPATQPTTRNRGG